jgi:hypothetical protein
VSDEAVLTQRMRVILARAGVMCTCHHVAWTHEDDGRCCMACGCTEIRIARLAPELATDAMPCPRHPRWIGETCVICDVERAEKETAGWLARQREAHGRD